MISYVSTNGNNINNILQKSSNTTEYNTKIVYNAARDTLKYIDRGIHNDINKNENEKSHTRFAKKDRDGVK